jgi:Spy/CpxP family protein refolding chaperone
MNKFLAFVCTATILVGASAAFAGEGCCAAGKAKQTSAKAASCDDVLAKMNLTDAQRAKLAELKADATKAGWSDEAKATYAKAVEQVLTPEQRAACKSACDTAAKDGKGAACPMAAGNKS